MFRLMVDWSALRTTLGTMQHEVPCPLFTWPCLTDDAPATPIRIRLQAWATDAAQHLNRQFGDDIQLLVGAFEYFPSGPRERQRYAVHTRGVLPVIPDGLLSVALSGSLRVRSGFATMAIASITNKSDRHVDVVTDGSLMASVLDETGRVVGGYIGLRRHPPQVHSIGAHAGCDLSLTIGTASFSLALGYAIPPGSWDLEIPLDLGHLGQYRMKPRELLIVDR